MEEQQKVLNVYQKLQRARVMLQEVSLKKSGKNKFSGHEYFNLSDFLPAINEIFDKLGLCSIVTFEEKQATMLIVNSEEVDEKIKFISPNAEVTLKGCHPMQNVGAVETYQRRYLYMTALEIVEADLLDATDNTYKIEEIKCDSCGEPIKPYKGRSVADMIEGSMKKYGKKLCSKCCLEMKKAEQQEQTKQQ